MFPKSGASFGKLARNFFRKRPQLRASSIEVGDEEGVSLAKFWNSRSAFRTLVHWVRRLALAFPQLAQPSGVPDDNALGCVGPRS